MNVMMTDQQCDFSFFFLSLFQQRGTLIALTMDDRITATRSDGLHPRRSAFLGVILPSGHACGRR